MEFEVVVRQQEVAVHACCCGLANLSIQGLVLQGAIFLRPPVRCAHPELHSGLPIFFTAKGTKIFCARSAQSGEPTVAPVV